MAKSKGKPTIDNVNVQAYWFKQLAYISGYQIPEGIRKQNLKVPDEVREKNIVETVTRQVNNYIRGFGPFHKAWTTIVEDVLKANKVSPFEYFLYSAFMNEYMKRVLGIGSAKPTETRDEIIAKFERMGAKRDVLAQIADALDGHINELQKPP